MEKLEEFFNEQINCFQDINVGIEDQIMAYYTIQAMFLFDSTFFKNKEDILVNVIGKWTEDNKEILYNIKKLFKYKAK